MGAFLGISLWITLATVIPGLVTIACIYFACVAVNPGLVEPFFSCLQSLNDWVLTGLGITVMILTQAFGILLEKYLIDKRRLGPESRDIEIAKGIDPHGRIKFTLEPYFEYQGLYILLAELREDEDTQGHLKRTLAQFFLTNNTLISFGAGILSAMIVLLLDFELRHFVGASIFIAVSLLLIFVSFKIAVIRFEVMTKALWAARQRRIQNQNG